MKRILVIASAFVLLGAGCAKTKDRNTIDFGNGKIRNAIENNARYAILDMGTVGSGFVNREQLTTEEMYQKASEDAGYKIYYPTYMPTGFTLSKNLFWLKEYASLALEGGTAESQKIILIMETSPLQGDAPLPTRYKKAPTDEIVSVNGQEGYFGTYGTEVKFNKFVFKTKEGSYIAFWTKFIGKDEMQKIAESMK